MRSCVHAPADQDINLRTKDVLRNTPSNACLFVAHCVRSEPKRGKVVLVNLRLSAVHRALSDCCGFRSSMVRLVVT